jgi:hypothetical protein
MLSRITAIVPSPGGKGKGKAHDPLAGKCAGRERKKIRASAKIVLTRIPNLSYVSAEAGC